MLGVSLGDCSIYDGASCTGASFSAPTSANMPLAFDNLTTSLRFF